MSINQQLLIPRSYRIYCNYCDINLADHRVTQLEGKIPICIPCQVKKVEENA